MRMMKSSSSFAPDMAPIGRRGSVGSLLALASTAVLVLGSQTAAQSTGGHPDVDGDGLVYAQEHVIGTSPTSPDTDHDGFSDLEEIARHSSPNSATSRPDPDRRLAIGMVAHAQSDGVHVLVSVFMSDMNLRSKQLQIGLYGHNQMITLSNNYLEGHSRLSFHPSTVTSGCVALIDLTLDPNIVHAAGHLTVWAKGALPGTPQGVVTTADALHLVSIAGIVLWAMPVERLSDSKKPGDGTTSSIYMPLIPAPSGGGSGGNGSGSGGGGGVPATWEPGEVCFQHSTPVGTDGAAVVNEVIGADCVGGWDGFCPPSCAASVGSTYRTVDPLVLIGG
jgi:hypothetical protein